MPDAFGNDKPAWRDDAKGAATPRAAGCCVDETVRGVTEMTQFSAVFVSAYCYVVACAVTVWAMFILLTVGPVVILPPLSAGGRSKGMTGSRNIVHSMRRIARGASRCVVSEACV